MNLKCMSSQTDAESMGHLLSQISRYWDRYAEKLGGDFAILPSSVHELIIIPEIKKHMLPELKTMVEDVNRTLVVEQGTFLSDNVYVYDDQKRYGSSI